MIARASKLNLATVFSKHVNDFGAKAIKRKTGISDHLKNIIKAHLEVGVTNL